METVTILTLTIGTAIAKAILSNWLGDDTTTSASIAADLLDLLRDKVIPGVKKDQAVTQIEAIGQRIAARLRESIVEAPDVKIEAVAYELAMTLEQASITPELIIADRLEPQKLADYLWQTRPNATEPFSKAETSLYKRLLKEVSREIIEVADELKGFSRSAFVATWQGQEQILAAIARLHARPSEEMARFEEEYRLAVSRELDKMEIFGIPYADQLVRQQSLSVAYITLQAEIHEDNQLSEQELKQLLRLAEDLNISQDVEPELLRRLVQAEPTSPIAVRLLKSFASSGIHGKYRAA